MPSEKAFAYKMRLETMKRQGQRSDSTSSPVATKLQSGRSDKELGELVGESKDQIRLKEPHINTAVYKKALQSQVTLTGDKIDFILQGVNQYLMELAKDQIRIAFEQAELEVVQLRQRTREGIETARQNGKQIGRIAGKTYATKKSEEAKEAIRKHSKAFGGGLSDAEVMKLAGCSRNSYYKYKRELLAINE